VYGLEAIAAHNGWAQAATGAIIVMCGLTTLSIVISFLPKLVALLEKKKVSPAMESEKQPLEKIETNKKKISNINLLQNISETAITYTFFIEPLGKSFNLNDLYKTFEKNDLPHPHLTIKSFRETGFILPIGKGRFTWKIGSK
jgi:hypothetical protein